MVETAHEVGFRELEEPEVRRCRAMVFIKVEPQQVLLTDQEFTLVIQGK
jgi:hypothetical protein